MTDFTPLRQQFPQLETKVHGIPLIYLDSAATTQKPQCVLDAMAAVYQHSNANVHRANHALGIKATAAFEAARCTAQRFINAQHSQEIIWTRGATEAINLVANSWGRTNLKTDDEILLTVMEHHANIVPWQLIAQSTGAVIRVVDINDDGSLNLPSFYQQLSARTKLVALSHASNTLGTINPIKPLIDAAHEVGAVVLVDGTQAIVHQPVDVQALSVDFYVFSGHKLYSPWGVGVLYGRRELLEAMPPWQGGGEMIKRVSFDKGTTFNELPFKFEAGTPNVAGAVGLSTGLTFLREIDSDALWQYEHQLRLALEKGLRTINGVRIIGEAEQKLPVTSFTSEHFHHHDLSVMLDRFGIAVRAGHHCTMPLMQRLGLDGTVRASLALYNTDADVQEFVAAMAELHAQPLFAVDNNIHSEAADDVFAHYLLDLAAIEAKLSTANHWQERYRQIMLLGKALPDLPLDWKSDAAQLHGCETQVWLHHRFDGEQLFFAGDADSRIMRGLMALLFAQFNGKTPQAMVAIDVEPWFKSLDLYNHLSDSRGNGLRSIVKAIHATAASFCNT